MNLQAYKDGIIVQKKIFKVFNKSYVESVIASPSQIDINFKDEGFFISKKEILKAEKILGMKFNSISAFGTSGISLLFIK